jgi:hypothetical protein
LLLVMTVRRQPHIQELRKGLTKSIQDSTDKGMLEETH